MTGPFPQEKRSPWTNNHYQALTLHGCCEEAVGVSPAAPCLAAGDTPSLAESGREGEGAVLIWPGGGQMFSLMAPKRRQHLGRGNLSTRPESPLKIPLKSCSSKQWSLHKLHSGEYTLFGIYFGILPPFLLTVR